MKVINVSDSSLSYQFKGSILKLGTEDDSKMSGSFKAKDSNDLRIFRPTSNKLEFIPETPEEETLLIAMRFVVHQEESKLTSFEGGEELEEESEPEAEDTSQELEEEEVLEVDMGWKKADLIEEAQKLEIPEEEYEGFTKAELIELINGHLSE